MEQNTGENSGFNPSEKDLLNLDEKILELKADKQRFIKSKLMIEGSLSIMANKYNRVDFNSPEFLKIKEDRQKLKQEAGQVELEIRKINEQILNKSRLKQEVEFHLKGKKRNSANDDKAIRQLVLLKEKYNAFAKDKTRVSSMRIMANEIKDEIEKILNNW